jgi:hypothetical protein
LYPISNFDAISRGSGLKGQIQGAGAMLMHEPTNAAAMRAVEFTEDEISAIIANNPERLLTLH